MLDELGSFPFRPLHDLLVADQVGNTKRRNSGLSGTEEFAGAAQFKISFRDPESVRGFNHGTEAFVRNFGSRLVS